MEVTVRRLWLALWLTACSGSNDAPRSPSAALVRVASVQAGSLTESWHTVGEVRALEQAALAVGADGPVARVLVREGDRSHRVLGSTCRSPAPRLARPVLQSQRPRQS